MSSYVLVALLVFGVNLLPAFAASGRFVLATAVRHLRRWLSRRYVSNTQAAGELLMAHRRASILGLGLFVLSPLPSAQLFEAAGLMAVRLLPLAAAFFVGRLASYSLYVGGVHAARKTPIGQLITQSLTSPWAIALQVLMLVGIVAVGRVDWAGAVRRRSETGQARQRHRR